MKRRKLTPAFPPEVKPVHVGVYSSRAPDRRMFAFWNGKRWAWWQYSVAHANALRDTNGAAQDKAWRGLAVKP